MAQGNSHATAIRLRADLICVPQEQAGAACLIVKDPRTQRFFRFGTREAFVVRHLDGTLTPEALRARVEQALGSELPASTLADFISRLGRLGLLEGSRTIDPPAASQTILHFRVRIFDPDHVLGWLLPRTRVLFSRGFLVASTAWIAAATVLTWIHSADIAVEMSLLLRGSSLLLAWITVLAIGFAHEIAHGLTCKRYGGQVREIGCLLIFFLPALYCNVSDTWLLREKRQRLFVLYAGVHCHLVLWAAAVVAWRLTAPDNLPHHLALVVMATCGLYTVFNLNPLIRLDGYYLLSDYLEIPNLRARAFRYLRGAAANWWRPTSPALPLPATPRERRIYAVYGVLAVVYSASLLGFIAFTVGDFLTEEFRGFGFVLYMVIVMLLISNFWKTLASTPASGSRRAAPRDSRGKRRAAVVLAAAGLAAAVLWRLPLNVSGEFRILPAHNADVRAQVAGILEEILVKEGESVRSGQTLARLAMRDLRSELRSAEAAIAEKTAMLKMLERGPIQQEIDLARREVVSSKSAVGYATQRHDEAQRMRMERRAKASAGVEKAEEQLKYAETYLEVQRRLFETQLVARLDLQKAIEQVGVRQKELQEARAALHEAQADDLADVRALRSAAEQTVARSEGRLALLLAGSRREQIEATAAEIARLEVHREAAAEHLRLAELRSPIAGIVTTPRLEEAVGQHVDKGDLVAEVFDVTSVVAEILVSEHDIGEVQVGDPVTLKARAYFRRQFDGRVLSIAPALNRNDGGGTVRLSNTVRVATRIDNPMLLLKPEMTGVAKIHCGSRRLVDLITRRLVRYLKVEFWSYW